MDVVVAAREANGAPHDSLRAQEQICVKRMFKLIHTRLYRWVLEIL